LDEDVRPLLAEVLRGRGYDVVSAVRAHRRGVSDEEQLQTAIEGHRTLVTHNIRDFVRLHAAFADHHYGLLVSNQEPFSVMLRRLLCFLSRETVGTVRGRLCWLSDYEPAL
jgi:hypothetical protein